MVKVNGNCPPNLSETDKSESNLKCSKKVSSMHMRTFGAKDEQLIYAYLLKGNKVKKVCLPLVLTEHDLKGKPFSVRNIFQRKIQLEISFPLFVLK